MSFKDCIASAVADNRISADRGQRAQDAFDEAYDTALAEGMGEGEATLAAQRLAMEKITNLNAARRWAKINEMQVAHKISRRFNESQNPSRALEELMEETENFYETVRSFAFSDLDRMLHAYKPRALRPARTENMDETVHAAFGDVRNAEAKEFADSLLALQDRLMKWANMYGASIPPSEHRRLMQTHDAVKVSAVPRDTWVNDHLREGVLDWDVMQYEGAAIQPGQRREILERVWDGIVSDAALREDYLVAGAVPNLAGRLNRDRFLHYANGDAWLEMQGKYGAGNLYEQTVGMVEAMAKDISLLKSFGPSPQSMKEFAKRKATQRETQLAQSGGKDIKRAKQKADRAAKVFDDVYNIHARHVPSADGNLLVQSISAIRTTAVTGQLGGILIPNLFGDLASTKFARQLHGMPVSGVARNYFDEVRRGNIATSEAVRLGVIFDNAVSLASSRVRYFGALDGPAIARVFSDQVYRIGLAAAHTQIARNAEGKQFLGFLADTRKMRFDDHPLAPAMLEAGITEADWNTMRAFPLTKVNGAEFLVPLDMWNAGDSAQKAVAEKFSNMMQSHIRLAVPDTTLRGRRAMGEAIDPNSAMGQMVRTMTSFMSFPVAVHFNQLRRIAAAPRVRDKLTLGASYFAWMTGAGAIITQAKALLNGQQPYDMRVTEDNNYGLDFWGRAIINGGSMGILGDLVMNNINMNNSSFRPGDPTSDLLKAVHKLTVDNAIDAINGDDINGWADAVSLADKMVPKFWQIKLLMQRNINDELLRITDPAGYRAKKRYEREHVEGMWWGMGEDPEAIRPSTAFGDY